MNRLSSRAPADAQAGHDPTSPQTASDAGRVDRPSRLSRKEVGELPRADHHHSAAHGRGLAATGKAQHRRDREAQAALGPTRVPERLLKVRGGVARGLRLDRERAPGARRDVVDVSAARLLEVMENQPTLTLEWSEPVRHRSLARNAGPKAPGKPPAPPCGERETEADHDRDGAHSAGPVSYTHLTLPTIYSV